MKKCFVCEQYEVAGRWVERDGGRRWICRACDEITVGPEEEAVDTKRVQFNVEKGTVGILHSDGYWWKSFHFDADREAVDAVVAAKSFDGVEISQDDIDMIKTFLINMDDAALTEALQKAKKRMGKKLLDQLCHIFLMG